MKRLFQVLLTVLIGALLFNTIGCSDDESSPTEPPAPIPPTILKVVVIEKDATAPDSLIVNANVVVYEAETGQAKTRSLTDVNGECNFELNEGNYYIQITAQNFDPSPAPLTPSIPFFVVEKDTTLQPIYLDKNIIPDTGYIKGFVEPTVIDLDVNNFLILAESSDQTQKFSTVSGPDGFFILYNLPYDTYSFEALKKEYMDSLVTSTIDAVDSIQSITIPISKYAGSTMSGSLSFIAGAEAKPTDMVLRDPVTLDIIPGMVTIADTTGGVNGYLFDNIPDGDFILWASLENDHNVMDPDKNLGGIDVSFPTNDGLDKPIDITGAIIITSPTNPMDSIYAFEADSIVPTFVWEKNSAYNSAKEMIIEVRDMNGNKIWGGFDVNGIVQHEQILYSGDVFFEYPSDGTAPDLIPGKTYQWKIYADNDADLNVQGLLSSSEDLRGIFQVPEAK